MSQSIHKNKQSFSRLIVARIEKTIQSLKSRTHCSCPRVEDTATCRRALALLSIRYREGEHKFLKDQYQYLSRQALAPALRVQIEKDVARTVDHEFPPEFLAALRTLLENVAKLRKKIGYLQGMNYIAAALLYHAEEWMAFAIMDTLLVKYELGRLFQANFEFMLQALGEMNLLLLRVEPTLHQHLAKNEIQPSSYGLPWYVSFFTVLAPIDFAIDIFEGIGREGLTFLHKTALAYLSSKAPALLHLEGPELQL